MQGSIQSNPESISAKNRLLDLSLVFKLNTIKPFVSSNFYLKSLFRKGDFRKTFLSRLTFILNLYLGKVILGRLLS